ncbi:MAG: PD-(D/E)XK nuclease family protein, partial [Candidatus Binataceae bacterium]
SSHDLLRQVGYLDRATRPAADAINQRRRDLERELESLASDQAESAAIVRIKLKAALGRLDAAAPQLLDLLAQLERLEAPGTIAGLADRLRQLMRHFGFELDDLSSREAGMAYAGLERALKELVGSAEMVALDRSFTAEEFAGLLESALTDAPLEDDGRDRGQSAGVRALPVMDARGLDFDLVLIIGLHDGGFPLYRGEDPIIPDDVRNALNRPLAAALRRRLGANAPSAPGKVIRTRADRNGEDWFLFFLALSTAEHEVVLTSPAADESGKPLTRSPFVAEVAALLEPGGTGISRRAQSGTPVPALADCFSRREFIARSVTDKSLGTGLAPLLGEASALEWIGARAEIEKRRELYLAIPAREQTENGEADARKLELAGPYDGRTGGAEGMAAILFGAKGHRPHWSASKLNQLVACGFKFFAGHLLELREEDAPDYESTALETGTLTHGILHELLESDIDFSDHETALRRARGMLGERYERERLSARDAAFFKLAWNSIERIVEELVEFECEQELEPGRERPILEHRLSFAIRSLPGTEPIELTLTGQLDRLELYRDPQRRLKKIRVLDYKTSRAAGKYADLANPEKEFARTDFQLALYLMGVLDQYRAELAPQVEIEAGYLVLKHWDKLQAYRISPELIEIDPQRRAQFLKQGEAAPAADRIVGLVMGAAAGYFDVDPLRCDDWCPFRRVCRYRKPGR